MVGRVIDAEGKPVHGLRIVSEEHGDTSDLDGRFAVQYKEPSQYVHFYYEGLWLRRRWRPEGDDLRILIRLPVLRDLEMFCDLSYQCSAEFNWNLEGNLEAVATTKCLPGIATSLARVPMGEPSVSCRSTAGTETIPRIAIEGRKLRLLPPPSPIRVTVHDRNRKTPPDCTVFVGTQAVSSVGGGIWIGEANGLTTVAAVCGGIPAVPQHVPAEKAERVVLQWLGEGPTLVLPDTVEDFPFLVLQSDTPKGGWRIRLDKVGTRTFRLPPLPIGDYRLSLGDPTILSRLNAGDPSDTDAVFWTRQSTGYLGSLRMTNHRVNGIIAMRGMEAE